MAGAASLTFNIIGRDQTKAAFNSAAAGAKKLGAGMKMGIAGAVAAVAGGGILQFGNDMIQIASDTAESKSKVVTLLGDMSDGALEFAESSATAIGISKKEYLGAVGNIAAVDRAMGTNQKEAAKLANEYVKLSADLGSFNNASSGEVQEALTASIAGEYEQLKKYGIVVNDTTLAAEAQRIGMEKHGSTWDSAQKRQLSYNIIMKSTAAAQGDFARTSGGLANQTKIVQAKFTDLKGEIGEKLLPVAVKMMGWLNKGIDIARKLGGALKPLVDRVKAFFGGLRGGGGDTQKFTGGMAKAASIGQRLGAWIRDDFLPAARRFGGFLRDDLAPAIGKVAGWLRDNLGPVIASVASTVRTTIVPAVGRLVDKFREAWPTISKVISILGKVAGFILTKVVPVLVKFAGVYLAKVIDVLGTVWSTVWKVIGVVVNIGEKVVSVGKKFWNFATDIGGAVKKAWDAVKEWIGKAVDKVKALPGDAASALGDLGRVLYEKGVDLVQGLVDGIVDNAMKPVNAVKDIASNVASKATFGILDFGSPSRLMKKYGQWTVEGFALGVKDRQKKVDAAMSAMTDRISAQVEKLKSKIESSKQVASDIRSSFRDFGNLTSLETGADAGKSFLAQLADKAAQAERFAKVVTALRKKGLNKAAIEDITAGGVESGLPIAEELMKGGVGTANALLARIAAAGGALGDREAYARTGIATDARGRAVVGVGRQRVAIDLNLNSATDDISAAIIKAIREQVRISGGDVRVVLGTGRR